MLLLSPLCFALVHVLAGHTDSDFNNNGGHRRGAARLLHLRPDVRRMRRYAYPTPSLVIFWGPPPFWRGQPAGLYFRRRNVVLSSRGPPRTKVLCANIFRGDRHENTDLKKRPPSTPGERAARA